MQGQIVFYSLRDQRQVLEATVTSPENPHRKKGIAAVLTRAAGIMQRQQAVGGLK